MVIRHSVLYVDFQTFSDMLDSHTVLDAMAEVDERIGYSQCSITIEDRDGNVLACREWNATLEGIEENEDPIQFGDFGYFSDWQVVGD